MFHPANPPNNLFAAALVESAFYVAAAIGLIIGLLLAVLAIYSFFLKKIQPGTAGVRTGHGGTEVGFDKLMVIPIIHRYEMMDISVKRIEIVRHGGNGLICKDNLRADISVAFLVRVNNLKEDVKKVANSIGCARASSGEEISRLFDAKFSEALKTVAKRFDFVELLTERETFRHEILKVIGTDLHGFVLDDCSIDHLDQTPLTHLDPNNILDAEGIKKIIALTTQENIKANQLRRNEEREIKRQDVEARQAILEWERLEEETRARQLREIAAVKSREETEALKIQEEERLKSERARIATEVEIGVALQNKEREVLVAQRNKERTDAVEAERVRRDRELEAIERDRLTTLCEIEKEKAIEIEKRNIQDVIRDRVMSEKNVVEERQKILDVEALAGAAREKNVAVILAEKKAEEDLIRKIKEAEAAKRAAELKADQDLYEIVRLAEAEKQAAEHLAEQKIIAAEAELASSEKLALAKKSLAEGIAAESSAVGKGEAEVMRAKAASEADGIIAKAEAMKLLNGAGREHEEFKLELQKSREIELAEIAARETVATRQAEVLGAALKSARIDIVGGESVFLDKITNAIAQGKAVDRILPNSQTLTDVKDTLFSGHPEDFQERLSAWIGHFAVSSEDLKNLSVAALLTRLMAKAEGETKDRIKAALKSAKIQGVAASNAAEVIGP